MSGNLKLRHVNLNNSIMRCNYDTTFKGDRPSSGCNCARYVTAVDGAIERLIMGVDVKCPKCESMIKIDHKSFITTPNKVTFKFREEYSFCCDIKTWYWIMRNISI